MGNHLLEFTRAEKLRENLRKHHKYFSYRARRILTEKIYSVIE